MLVLCVHVYAKENPSHVKSLLHGSAIHKIEELLSGGPLLILQKGTLLSWPAEGRGKAFYTQQLSCTLPLARGRKCRSSHRTEGRGRTEMENVIYHSSACPSNPFNLLWKPCEVFSISSESVRTNRRV